VVRAVHKFEFGFLQMKNLTNGGKGKEGHEVIEIHVFNCIFIFPLTTVMTIKEGYTCSADQLHSLEKRKLVHMKKHHV